MRANFESANGLPLLQAGIRFKLGVEDNPFKVWHVNSQSLSNVAMDIAAEKWQKVQTKQIINY